MISLADLTSTVREGRELSTAQVAEAAAALLDESAAGDTKADFLRALREKGETADEIAAFVRAFLERAVDPALDPARLPGPMLDVCGTGGDRMELFNISTTAMFVLAAGGAAVVKHGNRGITSRCGGADVLEELGVRIDLPPADLRRCVESTGLGFLFAPQYHPAFKAVGPIRRQLADEGIPTVFNLLGPLLNPARPAHQLIGIFSEALLPKIAETLALLGREHAWVVHGTSPAGGLDELSTLGISHVRKVTPAGIESFEVEPARHGFSAPKLDALRGGDRAENARITLGILDGSVTGPPRDLVLLNAGAAFVTANLAPTLDDGISLAREQLDRGSALRKLADLRRAAPRA